MTGAPEPADNVVRLIVGGMDGKLTTADGGRMPVRVFERGGRELMLVLMVAADESLIAEPLFLEYVSARGILRFRGTAVLEGRDLVRFHVKAEPEVLQRREFVRVDAVRPVVLTRDRDHAVIETHAIELSGGGMLLTGPQSLGLEDVVGFRLHLGGGTVVEGRGRVVRVEGTGRRALTFDDISQADRQRLIRFIFQCQRDALAKGAQVAPLKRGVIDRRGPA